MSEKEQKPKAPGIWGQSQAQYLSALRGKPVTIVFVDGKGMKGALTGVGVYELFIKQNSGLEVMIQKGSVKYLHPSEVE